MGYYKKTNTNAPKQSVYEIITNRMVQAMEETGIAPWRKPWTAWDLPKNIKTQKTYKGSNLFILAYASFKSPWWLTFNQAKELGGSIKKGEKGWPITYWMVKEKEEIKDGKKVKKKVFSIRYYTVFNVEQCENLRMPAYTEKPVRTFAPIEAAEKLLAAYTKGPRVEESKGIFFRDRACYSPLLDLIMLPRKEEFHGDAEYYATRFHEEIHGTGHKSRLAREGVTEGHRFGDEDYSMEELIAEMGAAMLCGITGIESTLENSVSYVKSWAKKLKEDPKMIITAGSKAQKAVEFMLGEAKEDSEDNAEGDSTEETEEAPAELATA